MIWHLNFDELFMLFAFLATFTYICGWLIDRIMGYGGFGVIGNWLILLLGSFVGMYGYNYAGYMFHWYPYMTVGVVAAAACATLIMMAMFKALLVD